MIALAAWFLGASVGIPPPDFLNADFAESDFRVGA